MEYFYITLVIISPILSFFLINVFTGKIFLGDSGAYFLGYFVAMYSLLLINQYNISPWYPVAILGYPIVETLFTIWRRIYRKKHHIKRGFFDAEKVHLHTLLYKRFIRKSNSLTSIMIMATVSIIMFISFLYYEVQEVLIFLFFSEVLMYILIYKQFFRNIENKNKKLKESILSYDLRH